MDRREDSVISCPVCGHEIKKSYVFYGAGIICPDGKKIILGPISSAIIRELSKARQPLNIERLSFAIYGPEYPLDKARNSLKAMISKMNKKLRPHGIVIFNLNSPRTGLCNSLFVLKEI